MILSKHLIIIVMMLAGTLRNVASFLYGRRVLAMTRLTSVGSIARLIHIEAPKASADSEPSTQKQKNSKVKTVKLADLSVEMASIELSALNSELERHNKLYFELNAPEISDAAYDKLVIRAEALVGKFRHLSHLIPTLDVVGMGKTSKFAPFVHSTPMLSLAKAFSNAELEQFLDRAEKGLNTTNINYIIEPKIDGLSLAVVYKREQPAGDWILIKAGTRGDGAVGEDVTENVRKYMKTSIPTKLSSSEFRAMFSKVGQARNSLEESSTIEVRGEVFISKQHFNLLNKKRAALGNNAQSAQLATARNAAAGALRKINSSNSTTAVEDRHLQFFAYSLLMPTGKGENATGAIEMETQDVLPLQSLTLRALQDLGFQVAQPHAVCTSRAEVLSTCQHWAAEKGKWDFEADGTVVKVDAAALQAQLGANSRCPRWAVAYKYADDTVLTKLLGIEVRVGRTGVLTPVARLEPVKVGGVLVERATLHNENEVNRLGVSLGDTVRLKRAGDVIPKIIGVEEPAAVPQSGLLSGLIGRSAALFRLPAQCPECGSPTERVAGGVMLPSQISAEAGESGETDGATPVTVRCTGGAAVCPAQVIEQISHFCSRDAADVDGLGRSRIEDLYEGGYVSTVLDLYRLRERDLSGGILPTKPTPSEPVALRSRMGWGDRSVNHLLAAVDRARVLDDHRFLFGLGVRHVGQENAKLLCDAFGGFPALWEYLKGEAVKLRTAGAQFHMLPRRRAVRASTKAAKAAKAGEDSEAQSPPSGDSDRNSEADAGILHLQDCAPRLQGVVGMGLKSVEALLAFAAAPVSAALVDGLLQQVQLSSQQGATKTKPEVTAVAGGGKLAARRGTEEQVPVPVGADEGEVTHGAALKAEAVAAPALPMADRVVVFTGKLESGMSRSTAQALCEELGGKTRSSINRTVNLVVQASDAENSSKHALALKNGVEIWTEEEWNAFLKVHNKL